MPLFISHCMTFTSISVLVVQHALAMSGETWVTQNMINAENIQYRQGGGRGFRSKSLIKVGQMAAPRHNHAQTDSWYL